MTPEQWERVKEYLEVSLELKEPDRSYYLSAVCVGQPEMLEELRSLIASYEEAGDLLESPPIDDTSELLAGDLTDYTLGRLIGPYSVVEEIGSGGMGTVYRAVRADEPGSRPVAIKVVRPGMDTGHILRRFENERQILAGLEHPNIARLFDAGTTADGLPYFVMEYIEGKPLDEYCDAQKLTVRQRLELFCTICLAVQYAHEKLVVHRDIKPGNILVTSEGVPKLLDFGIAKILNRELSSQTSESTATIFQMMTPEYASPEQVMGDRITAATDVYALGVLLFRLLSGHGPYVLRTRLPQELARAICEGEPEKPSRALFRVEEVHREEGRITINPELVSGTRGTDPEQLRRELAGDIDNMILMAIRKEPERRYGSVQQFAEDIKRHLRGERVRARTANLAYRGAKTFTQYRTHLVTAALVIMTLVAGTLAWQNRNSRGSAPAQKGRHSVAVLGFHNLSGRPEANWLSAAFSELVSTELGGGERLRTVPGEEIARVKMELGLSDAETFAKDTLFRIRNNLGTDYVVVGSYLVFGDRSDSTLRLDVKVQDAQAGETVFALSETGTQRELLSMVARVGGRLREHLGVGVSGPEQNLVRASQPANMEAARLYSEGLAKFRMYQTVESRDLLQRAVAADPRHALSHAALAAALSSLGYDAKAREEARKAYDLSSTLPREDRLFIEGRYCEITRDWPNAVEIYRTLWRFFPDSLDYGVRLAGAQAAAGRTKESMATIDALRKLPRLLAEDPRVDLAEADAASVVGDFARMRQAAARAARKGETLGSRIMVARARLFESRALTGLAQTDAAITAAQQAKVIYAAAGHRRGVALAESATGDVLESRGDVAGAQKKYEEALAICRQIGNRNGEAVALNSIGLLEKNQGELERAERTYREVLAIRRELGDQSGEALALGNLANVLSEKGDLGKARQMDEQALALYRANNQQRGIARILHNLALLAAAQGDLPQARRFNEDCLAIRRDLADASGLAGAHYVEGVLQFEAGDLAAARRSFDDAITAKRKRSERSWVARILVSSGKLALAEGNVAQARRDLEEALSLRKSLGERPGEAEAALALAEVALEENKLPEAEHLARTALGEWTRQGVEVGQGLARKVLAQVQFARGDLNAAAAEVEQGSLLLENSENRGAALALQPVIARVQSARGKSADAARTLEASLQKATGLGLYLRGAEIRLALGELEKNAPRGQARLAELRTDAGSKGYKLIAAKAAAVAR
jgi:serine/threonine protein kinase/tetratricopeptide (TPR) repeat protein/TolB-like protein